MRRWPNWIALSVSIAFLAITLMLVGCAGGSTSASDDPGPPPVAAGMLRQVRSAAELEASLKAGLRTAQAGDLAAAPTTRFSGTYTQETRVDELDVVRYDGTHLYVAPQRVATCCFIFPVAAGGPPAPAPAPRSIRILSTDPASGTASQIGSIALEDGVSVQGLYVTAGRAIALTSEAFYGAYGDFWSRTPFWAPTDFGIRVYDVSDPATPKTIFSATLDGVFVESRRVGDRVFIVSRYTPSVLLDPARRAELDTLPLESLLPRISIGGATRPLVDPARCYVTNDDGAAEGYPVITSITVIPIQDPGAFFSTCYNEPAVGVYVSERALYLTELRFTSPAQTTFTRVHKFGLAGTAPTYQGSVEIDGAVWSGGQADFRMSEHDGLLRVVTTQFDPDPTDSIDHRLYVLRQRQNAPALEIVGQLPNAQRPEEIGKPNESLYGVRFLGSRLFAVTFRRIDPLYVIDLANPADPRIAGQLELPGFSDFLHPVTDRLLLGLGEGDAGQLKLELFDVSAIDRPASRGSIVLGGRGSWSEARYDRHAFTYLADVAGVDRFAIPAVLYSDDGRYTLVESGLYLFEVHGKQAPGAATLDRAGAIIPRGEGGQTPLPPAALNRAFIHGDTVYYVRDEAVWSASWLLPSRVNGPF
jgi:hypothetical protein